MKLMGDRDAIDGVTQWYINAGVGKERVTVQRDKPDDEEDRME